VSVLPDFGGYFLRDESSLRVIFGQKEGRDIRVTNAWTIWPGEVEDDTKGTLAISLVKLAVVDSTFLDHLYTIQPRGWLGTARSPILWLYSKENNDKHLLRLFEGQKQPHSCQLPWLKILP
jgi:hypothetical protein